MKISDQTANSGRKRSCSSLEITEELAVYVILSAGL
jgi:hypothetical protein